MTKTPLLAAALLALGAQLAHAAQPLPAVDVYKSPYCGCCGQWVEHMQAAWFTVRSHNVDDVPAARKQLGMPDSLGSCHTARIGNYVIEGHVPAADVQRLLKEKPKAVGLAVPGMPQGAPGMETARPQPYDTLLVSNDGQTRVFARH